MSEDLPRAVVNARGVARIRAGHPWVFRAEVTDGPGRDAGDGGPALVAVRDNRGRSLGVATWAARARLAMCNSPRPDRWVIGPRMGDSLPGD